MVLKTKFIKTKLLNHLILKGQKQTSEKESLKCFKLIQKNLSKKNFKEILKLSVVNASPFFQLKKIKNKKNLLEIPYLLKNKLKVFYGMKNILKNATSQRENEFYKKLTLKLIKSSILKGSTIKQKKIIHEQAFLKKKYARYRWF